MIAVNRPALSLSGLCQHFRLYPRLLVLGLVLSWIPAVWSQGIPIYQLYVRSEDLERVQAQVPDAILVEGEEGIFILAGSFGERTNAERRLAELEQLGLPVQLVLRQPGDPTPVAVSPRTQPSPSPSPAPSPESTQPAGTQAAPEPVPGSPEPTPLSSVAAVERGVEMDPQRPYWVLVPNPTQDPQVAAQVRRFFPTAVDVIYQQQAALQTGTFNQLTLAQEQSRWLTNQGLTAVAIPNPALAQLNSTANPISGPDSSAGSPRVGSLPSQGEGLWVLVADPTGERLTPLQQRFSGAIPLRFDGIQVVKTGGFDDNTAAQQQVEQLAGLGYEAGIFPADLSRSEPVLSSTIPASDAESSPSNGANGAGVSAGGNPTFLVLVPADTGILEQVQQLVPDAFLRRYQDQTVVQVGSYRLRPSAEQAIQGLAAAGLRGQVVELSSNN